MRTPWRNPARRALVGNMHSVGRWRAKSTFSEHLARRDIANPFQGLPALEATIGRSIVARIGSSSLSHSPPPIHHHLSFSRRHPPSFSCAYCARDEHPHRECGLACAPTYIQKHGHIYTCRHTNIIMYTCVYHVATHACIYTLLYN